MSNNRRGRGIAVAALVLLGSAAPWAQKPSPRDTLASATAWKCQFTLMVLGDWKDGATKPEIKPASLSLGFKDVEAEEGTANAVGGFGPPHIITRLSTTALHFLQVARDGPLYVTTVFAKESSPGNLLAVHTRHEFTEVSIPGFTSRPEQYYGQCAATE